jgi:RNA polymerase sigma-70 factor (ECF subfamily)
VGEENNPFGSLSNCDLLKLFRSNNNNDAFAELYLRLWEKVYRVAHKRTFWDRDAAEELAQKAFTLLASATCPLGIPENDEHLSSWLLSVINNLALAAFRRRRKQPEALDQDVPEESTPLEIDRRELAALVQQYSARLAPKDWQLIELHFFEEISYEEIADCTGLTVGAIKMRIHRTKEELKEWLIADGWSPQGNG